MKIAKNINDPPIDLVYTWVDGKDPNWQKEKQFWESKERIEDNSTYNCRFVDNDELKFSLRSVAMYAPWIRKIFIITNGQIPKWLNVNHPKITIIQHKDIMPKDIIPTFNSNAIEAFIPNIQGLSECFLYANDDFFINKHVEKDFFFDKNCRPIIRLVKQNWTEEEINNRIYQNNVNYSRKLIFQKFNKDFRFESAHNICSYRKSYFLKCKEDFKKEFDRTSHCRFREYNCVTRSIVSFWTLSKKLGVLKKYNKKSVQKNCLHIGLLDPNSIVENLNKYKPTLFCINDNEWTHPDSRERLKNVLAARFPKSQEWELKNDFEIEPIFNTKDSINIVFATDNYFCKYFAVALQSLIDNSNETKKYDIIVFESDISSRNKKLLLDMIPQHFSLRFFDLSEYISETFDSIRLKPKNNWSISMYYRIFIPFIMKNYEKVLYLDSDVCVNKDITELFDIQFNDKQILVVKDSISPVLAQNKKRLKYMIRTLNLKNPENYFNSGMIMFNNNNIDKEFYKNEILRAFNIKDLLYPDQDILNVVFENKIKLIPTKWNYLYAEPVWGMHYLNLITGEYKKDFLEARKNPYIIHYCSPRKPWNMPSVEYSQIFWHYARKTPFYEEIVFGNTMRNINAQVIKNVIYRHQIYLKYLGYKILKLLSFGNKKEYFCNKIDIYKNKVNSFRTILKS